MSPDGTTSRLSPPEGLGFRTDPPDDWSVVMQSRGNVLVWGAATAIDAFIVRFGNHAPPPIRRVTAQSFVAPSCTDGTLILQDVDALDRAQQAALLRWLETPQIQTRVIATSTTPLYDQVRAGTFLGPLFYRLNVLHITVVPE